MIIMNRDVGASLESGGVLGQSDQEQKKGFSISRQIVTGCVFILDVLLLTITGLGIYWFYVFPDASNGSLPYFAATGFLVCLVAAFLSVTGFYRFDRVLRPIHHLGRFIAVVVAAFLVLVAFGFLFKISVDFSRGWLLSWLLIGSVSLVLLRLGVPVVLRRLALKGQLTKNILVFGAGKHGRELVRQIEISKEPWTRVIGIFDERLTRVADQIEGLDVQAGLQEMIELGRLRRADEIVIALPWNAQDRILEIIRALAVLPAQVSLSPELTRKELLRPEAWVGSGIDHAMPVLTVVDKPVDGWAAIAKQALDYLLGGLFTLIALPVMLLIAALIKLDSPGPVLFKQNRYGFNNQLIGVYKFRSMYIDQSDQDAAKLTQRNDPRVTRIGAFLRRSSLDELPQLFNVLKGEMSVVGPRPHAVQAKAGGTLYEDVIAEYAVRHKVKPGITGWAQVNGWRGNTETEEDLLGRVRHDLYYIENWSVFLDLVIIFKTAWAVVEGENSY